MELYFLKERKGGVFLVVARWSGLWVVMDERASRTKDKGAHYTPIGSPLSIPHATAPLAGTEP